MSAFYPHVTRPLKGVNAFREISETAAQPQAAILLLLGRQLRGNDAMLAARARAEARVSTSDLEDLAAFPVPELAPSPRTLKVAEVQRRAKRRFGYSPTMNVPSREQAYRASADRLYAEATVEAAAELMEMCLDHPHKLVRIAAAYAYVPLTSNPRRCMLRLVEGLRSADPLERELAATALARIQPNHPALRVLSRRRRPGRQRRPAHTITLVHGTWASSHEWYQPPAGSFFQFIENLRNDLYGGSDFFSWTGGYSDFARAEGAVDLTAWVQQHGESGLDLIGHSHGANVILRATQLGLQTRKVVLLSCPVHVSKYFPDFTQVQRPVYSVRVKMDLVILVDGGGQRFNHPDIDEIVLPIWFDHSASRAAQVWQLHNVAQRIGL